MNIPDEAVQAAIEAIGAAPGSLFKDDSHAAHSYAAGCPVCSGDIPVLARVALTAAYPLIVAQVAEQIAQAIQGVECRITDEYDVGLQEGLVRGQRVARSFKDAR